ncbi:PREDICTED: GATA transcription factor 5-like [Camelina sativa]|uniref:GATA transcription factor n=1 Tax=Camelina sativa TaxID=90675 RepID=A0ABM0UR39_CAMSA|nr:PREDICTED: GATA transcription factor 5-like [Camelina sativa]
MEQAALKSSIRKEMAFKTTPPVFEDFLAVTTTTTAQNADDFSVDDLLDLSNDDVFADDDTVLLNPQEHQDMARDELNDVAGDALPRRSNDFSGCDDFGSELSVPADDLANLEWLSHFVEDSFTEYSGPNLTGTPIEKPAWLTGDRKHPVTPATEESCFKSPVPAKARSKRHRNGVKSWSLGSSSSSGPSSSGSTSSSSSSGPSSPWFSGSELLDPMVTLERPPFPKKHKKRSAESAFCGQLLQPQRRCSHCGVQKTPQWRAGPMGAKTLCNACGVRYKSGRLLPEYRPACSPTFSSELHSNHHRKVMEMRRKKEPASDNETGLNQLVQSPQAVPSF